MDTQLPPKSDYQRQRKQDHVLLVLIILGGVALTTLTLVNNVNTSCYTVAEVWKNARALTGTQICVQGKAQAIVEVTLLKCDPDTCGCNRSKGELRLVSEETTLYNPDVSITDYITIDSPSCNGDQCSITCSPFDPSLAEYFRFVGKLSTTERNGEIAWLKLENLDLSTSRQMIGGIWQTIPLGTFLRTWPTWTPTSD